MPNMRKAFPRFEQRGAKKAGCGAAQCEGRPATKAGNPRSGSACALGVLGNMDELKGLLAVIKAAAPEVFAFPLPPRTSTRPLGNNPRRKSRRLPVMPKCPRIRSSASQTRWQAFKGSSIAPGKAQCYLESNAEKPRSRATEKTATRRHKLRSREAEKPRRSSASRLLGFSARSREAERPRSREAEKARSREAEKPIFSASRVLGFAALRCPRRPVA